MKQSFKEKIESGFEKFTLYVCNHPWKILAPLFLVIMFLLIQVPQLSIDVTTEGMFGEQDESYQNYIQFKKQFGDDTAILIVLTPKNIYDQKFLKKLQKLHKDLENNAPYLEDVTSIINVTNIKGEGNKFIVQDLMEDWPQNEKDLQKLKKYVENYPAYQNQIISNDGNYTAIIVRANVRGQKTEEDFLKDDDETVVQKQEKSIIQKIKSFLLVSQKSEKDKMIVYKNTLTNEQNNEFVEKVTAITNQYKSADFPLFLTGNPVILKEHLAELERTFGKTIQITLICIFFLILIIFRRFSVVGFTILVIVLTLGSTFGIMSILHIPVRTATQVFPPIVLTAGICDAIHVFTIFYQQLAKLKDKKMAIAATMKHSGLAMFFTTITTMGGFLSFSLSELLGIVELGLCAALGIFIALVYTYLIIPALISLLPISQKPLAQSETPRLWEQMIKKTAVFASKNALKVLIVAAVILAASVTGAHHIKMSFQILKWFPKSTKFEEQSDFVDNKFKGGTFLEIIVDTGKVNGLFDPDIMNRIEKAQKVSENLRTKKAWVGKTISIADTLKQINKSLNKNNEEFYRIPQDEKKIAQQLLLYENSGWDNLKDIVDTQFSKTRITLKMPNLNAIDYIPFRDDLSHELDKIFKGKARITLTGSVDMTVQSAWGLINSFFSSYLLAGITISLLLILLTASIRVGLMAMIPNFFPIAFVLGVMGVFNLPITMFTVLLGGIALGLAVDDTIHFLHVFKRNFKIYRNVEKSIVNTIQTTGKALFFTSLTISIGFLSFLFAEMLPLKTFGILTGLTVIIAFISDLMITPALLSFIFASKQKNEDDLPDKDYLGEQEQINA